MTENQNFYIILALIGLFFIWSIIIFRYYLKMDKGSIELRAADKQHEHKHIENVERIKKLEAEKEKHLAKIENLEGKIILLEQFINKYLNSKESPNKKENEVSAKQVSELTKELNTSQKTIQENEVLIKQKDKAITDLNNQEKVQLVDTDPLQTSQTWIDNCQKKGRKVSATRLPDYQIIDTAGSSGSYLGWIRSADIIIIPLQMHYADLKITLELFLSWNQNLQSKTIFLPNRWQNTKEQREGAKQLQSVVLEQKAGSILPTLGNRPALYGELLNGGKDNFFNKQNAATEEAKQIMKLIVNNLKKRRKGEN